jgi:hypothetical protein
MRLLKFNNVQIDIDEQTAIGLDFQGYDVQDPGKRKVAVSNTFTIPKTSHNLKQIGHAGNPQSISLIAYNPIIVQYYNGNKQLIRNGSARITEVSNRITLMVYEKATFWDLMNGFLWPNVQLEFLTWLQTTKSYPSATNPFVGTFQAFVEGYINTTEGLILPHYISNFANYSPDELTYLEDTSNLWLKYNTSGGIVAGIGGHFCAYCKTLFEFIEYKYDVDFSVTSLTYDYNIFQDDIAKVMYVPARNISIQYTTTGFYFRVDTESQFLPDKNTFDKESKSLYDFTKSFFQHFMAIIDKIPTTDLSEKYIIRRGDELPNAPVIDFSEGLDHPTKEYPFKPILNNYKQTNYIKFSSIFPDGDKLRNSKKIVCHNRNLDAGTTDDSLFTIDAYVPGEFVLGGDFTPDMSVNDSFKTFTFFISQGSASANIKAMENGDERTTAVVLNVAKLYSLASEYNVLASMATYPKFYTIKKWLTLNQIDRLVYFARYWVRDLNGYYFLNKVSGYNPQKSTEPTTIELIKLS